MQSNLYPELKNSKFKVLIFELPQQTSDTQNDKKINIPRKLFECCFFLVRIFTKEKVACKQIYVAKQIIIKYMGFILGS